jgi:guanylate cyclase soluble subunit beta
MYGWIHECYRGMILSNYGEELWQIILSTSNIPQDKTWELEDYLPDSMFFTLLSTTCHVLQLTETVITDQYSEYFVFFLHQKGYDKLLRCLGLSLFEWLSNVNQVHQHFLYLMPQMQPPNIW